MGIKKNFLFSGILTVSNYLFPLITFPYISRVLGVKGVGLYNYVDNIINYFILISMMGISIIGIRVIAQNKDDKIKLNKSFSSLFLLNAIFTVIATVILITVIELVPKFSIYKEMLYIGSAKLFFNLFLIEWFYKGIENFKLITIRTILIKLIYVILIFLFINNPSDYKTYYLITICSVLFNAIVNWIYSKKFVVFSIKTIDYKPYIPSIINLGVYALTNSIATTFNIMYLGLISGDTEVGYYTTAAKIYNIFLALYTAFTGVMLPRMSALVKEGNITQVKILIQKSFNILFLLSFPVLILVLYLSPEIVYILAGSGYEGAIFPMRIIMPLIIVIGIEQIFVLQILLPLNRDRSILMNSVVGAVISIVLNLLLVKGFKSSGVSLAWLISEIVILILSYFSVRKVLKISIPINIMLKHFFIALPCLLWAYILHNQGFSPIQTLCLVMAVCLVYMVVCYVYVLKEESIINIISFLKFKNT